MSNAEGSALRFTVADATECAEPPAWARDVPAPWSGRCHEIVLPAALSPGTYQLDAEIEADYEVYPKCIVGDGRSVQALLKLFRVGPGRFRTKAILTAPATHLCFASDDLQQPAPWSALALRRESRLVFLTAAARQLFHLARTDRRRLIAFLQAAWRLVAKGKAPTGVSAPPASSENAYREWIAKYEPDADAQAADRALRIDAPSDGRFAELAVPGCDEPWIVAATPAYRHRRNLPDAIADHLTRSPDCALVTFDDDLIGPSGERAAPYFRPQWSPCLLGAWNYIGQAFAIRRSGFAALTEAAPLSGTDPYADLLRRAKSGLEADRIEHLARVLAHWRTDEGAADPRLPGTGWPRRAATAPAKDRAPSVDILIPTRNRLELLSACIDSIEARTEYPNCSVTVIDNGSDDPETLAYLDEGKRSDRFRVVRDDGPFNYSRLNNAAAGSSNADYLLLLNNDTTVINGGWLSEMMRHFDEPDVGAVGAKLYFPNGRIQHAGLTLGLLSSLAGHLHKEEDGRSDGYFGSLVLPREVSAVTGACLLVPRDLYRQVEGLDEKNLPIAFNDVDFCLKIRERRRRIIWTPWAELVHYESVSRGTSETGERALQAAGEVDYMRRRWGSVLRTDPYFSPNLSHQSYRVLPSR